MFAKKNTQTGARRGRVGRHLLHASHPNIKFYFIYIIFHIFILYYIILYYIIFIYLYIYNIRAQALDEDVSGAISFEELRDGLARITQPPIRLSYDDWVCNIIIRLSYDDWVDYIILHYIILYYIAYYIILYYIILYYIILYHIARRPRSSPSPLSAGWVDYTKSYRIALHHTILHYI